MLKQYTVIIFILLQLKLNAQVFNGNTGNIPDNGWPTSFANNVTGLSPSNLTAAYGLKKVCLDITHPYISDLTASLKAPDGTVVTLFAKIGGDQDNFTNTCFDSFAVSSITTAPHPYTGTFRPQGNLGNVNNGQSGNGLWELIVSDDWTLDSGTVNNWSLEFTFNAPTPLVLKTDLPLVVIKSNNQNLNENTKTLCEMKIINNGNGILNSSTDSGNVYFGNAGIKYRGASSLGFPQKSMSVELYDNVNSTDSNVSLLDMPKEHDWILLTTYNDKSFVRNPLMYDIFNKMGHYSARNKHVEVMLNGQYMGVYILVEKIKRDDNRLDVPKLSVQDTIGNNLTGGYIIQHAFLENGWSSVITPPNCNRKYTYNYEYPSPTMILPEQATYIKNFVTDLEAKLHGNQVNDSILGYRPMIDVNSFIDYMLCTEMSWNGDGYKKSLFLHKFKNNVDSGLHAGPVWDFDWGLKRMPWTPTDYSGWMYSVDPCDGDNLHLPWWNIMMKDSFFRDMSKCRWEYHRKNSLHLDSIYKFIDTKALSLSSAQYRHFDLWQTLGQNNGTPEVAPLSLTYQQEIDTLRSIITQRITWIDKNIPGTCKAQVVPVSNNIQTINTSIDLSPNPTNDLINIESNETIKSIVVYDIAGQLMDDVRLQNKTYRYSMAKFQQGIYILCIRTKGQVVYKKVQKL